jgi:hypothetical protein
MVGEKGHEEVVGTSKKQRFQLRCTLGGLLVCLLYDMETEIGGMLFVDCTYIREMRMQKIENYSSSLYIVLGWQLQ